MHLFDPKRPFYYDIGLEGFVQYKIKNGLTINLTTQTSVLTTFDDVCGQ